MPTNKPVVLYIGNLPENLKAKALYDLISKKGKIHDLVPIPHSDDPSSTENYAFALTKSTNQAQRIVSALNGKKYQGRYLIMSLVPPEQTDEVLKAINEVKVFINSLN